MTRTSCSQRTVLIRAISPKISVPNMSCSEMKTARMAPSTTRPLRLMLLNASMRTYWMLIARPPRGRRRRAPRPARRPPPAARRRRGRHRPRRRASRWSPARCRPGRCPTGARADGDRSVDGGDLGGDLGRVGLRDLEAARRRRHRLEPGTTPVVEAARWSRTMLPRSSSITRRRMASTMAWSCVAITTVVPVRLMRSRIRMMPTEVAGSRFPVGSSASRISGRLTKARAIETRCCSPPESWRG